MREILFRGKTYDGHWIYGNLLVKGSFCYIIGTDDSKAVEVIPDSVGQYTGLKDCKGNKIFEGDILTYRYCLGEKIRVGYVEYRESLGVFLIRNGGSTDTFSWNNPVEVIGNTTDNKDLLTKQTEQ